MAGPCGMRSRKTLLLLGAMLALLWYIYSRSGVSSPPDALWISNSGGAAGFAAGHTGRREEAAAMAPTTPPRPPPSPARLSKPFVVNAQLEDGYNVLLGPWPLDEEDPGTNATTVRDMWFYNTIAQRTSRHVVAIGMTPREVHVLTRCAVSVDGGRTWPNISYSLSFSLKDYLRSSAEVVMCPLAEWQTFVPGAEVRLRVHLKQDCLYRLDRDREGPNATCPFYVDPLEFRDVPVEPAFTAAELAAAARAGPPPPPAIDDKGQYVVEPLPPAVYQYNVVACVPSFHGHVDADRVRPWIEYHRRLGVEHFYFYELASDLTLEHPALADLAAHGLVSLRRLRVPRWLSHYDNYEMYRDMQNAIWRPDCLHRAQSTSRYAFFADVDEYVVLLPGAGATTFPALFADRPDAASVSFGSVKVDITHCADPATGALNAVLPALGAAAASYWRTADWVKPFVYRTREAECSVRKIANNSLCPHFYGRRKFVLDTRKVLGGIAQHTAGGATFDFDTSDAYLLHFRGVTGMKPDQLCVGGPFDPVHLPALEFVPDLEIPRLIAAVYAQPLPPKVS